MLDRVKKNGCGVKEGKTNLPSPILNIGVVVSQKRVRKGLHSSFFSSDRAAHTLLAPL